MDNSDGLSGKTASQAGQVGENVAGTIGEGLTGRRTNALQSGRATDRAIHAKTVRRLWNHFQIGEGEMNALTIVAMWCIINEREGGNEQDIVNWSGARAGWTRKVRSQVRECCEAGLLERVKVPGGERVCITAKGARVLEFYDRQFAIEFEVMEARRITERLKKETARLNKERRASERKQVGRLPG